MIRLLLLQNNISFPVFTFLRSSIKYKSEYNAAFTFTALIWVLKRVILITHFHQMKKEL
jgi:hypothetical protein